MSYETLQQIKGWNYMKKTEKISLYLKDKNKEYPIRPISLNQYLAECSFDLGYKKEDFESYIKTMEQLGYVEIIEDMIVSVQARAKAEANEASSEVVEEIMK